MAKAARPAQDLVEVREVRDGVLLLKDGSFRVVLIASSINFALKSQEEQDAIVLQYQNFLNSLDFSIEFFIQSRKLNIDPYLDILRERLKHTYNDLMKIQITEYVDFVSSFVGSANIMAKNFYIVVPFTPVTRLKKKEVTGALSSLLKGNKNDTPLEEGTFEEYKTQLYQRVEVVRQGLIRTGVRVVPLNTEELVELFYELYNPGEAEKGKLPEVAS
jgi:type IV secretory pathway VirB4 component